MKKIISMLLTLLVLCSLLTVFPGNTVANAAYFNTYSDIASLPNSNSCASMQGMAIGKTYIYCIKRDDNDANCIIYKVARESKNKLLMTNSSTGDATIAGLGHANDACLVEINGVDTMFVVTMEATTNNLWRIELSGDYYKVVNKYSIKLDGSANATSGIDIMSFDGTTINFLFKKGANFYTGSLDVSASTGTVINMTKKFTINVSSVVVNGTTTDLSSYTYQGFGYYKGWIFVPVTSEDKSIVIVYENVDNASGTIKSKSDLSFRITSSTYAALFEMESCGIAPDGMLYFNTNRRKSSSDTNYDALHVFKEFNISAYETGTPVISATSQIDAGATGTVSWAACANATKYNYTAVFKSASGTVSTVASATDVTGTAFTLPAVSEAGTVTVTVTAVGSLGNASASKVITVINPVPTDITVGNIASTVVKSETVTDCFRGFKKATSVDAALAEFAEDNAYLQIRDVSGAVLDSAKTLCTGYTVNIVNGSTVIKSYSLVVEGDINGDGVSNGTDILVQAGHIQAMSPLTGAALVAADYDKSGTITTSDYLSLTGDIINNK